MGMFRMNITMSLDGFIAGPNQSVEHPLGVGGMALHDWAFALESWRRQHGLTGGEVNASTQVVEAQQANVGAVVMGRNMFGGHPGPWTEKIWNGWWGEEPPFHAPVFVVTHHAREPLAMKAGTTFYFVTEGIEVALDRARQAAGSRDIALGGGANVARQYLAEGLLDELTISLVPCLLGAGERLFAGVDAASVKLAQLEAVPAPGVTHLRYRAARSARAAQPGAANSAMNAPGSEDAQA